MSSTDTELSQYNRGPESLLTIMGGPEIALKSMDWNRTIITRSVSEPSNASTSFHAAIQEALEIAEDFIEDLGYNTTDRSLQEVRTRQEQHTAHPVNMIGSGGETESMTSNDTEQEDELHMAKKRHCVTSQESMHKTRRCQQRQATTLSETSTDESTSFENFEASSEQS